MHYTSISNIRKVIDPLFLNDLKLEFETIDEIQIKGTRDKKFRQFQDKIASLHFLDPACGSGNFLTETYLCLRKLENKILERLYGAQVIFGMDGVNPIKVGIGQFAGIEINDFAVTVARTALWIAESQMMKETEAIVHMELDFLPLKTSAHIVEGNALQMNWGDVTDRKTLDYIMGNPPFVGYSLQSKEQKADIKSIYTDKKGKPYKTAGKIDFVAAWYFKAAEMMFGTKICTAFGSTNSITQGEQVAAVWKPLYERFEIHIDFAYQTFVWNSEAKDKAAVHCIIVGFSWKTNKNIRFIYMKDGVIKTADNISPYLFDSPVIFVESRNHPISNVPEILKGSSPVDGGNLLIDDEERNKLIKVEPNSSSYIKRFYGAREYLHNKKRWCLWLLQASPNDINSMPLIKEHVLRTRDFRLASKKAATRNYAAYPTRFMEIRQPSSEYILIPRHSSQNRKYIPCIIE